MSDATVSMKKAWQIEAELRQSYESSSVDVLMKFLDIEMFKNLEFRCSFAENSISLNRKFMLSGGQLFFIEIILAQPLFLYANFRIISCTNNLHKRALQFAKKDLKKTVTINSLTEVEKVTQEFGDHVDLSMKLFKNLRELIKKKSNGLKDGVVFVSPQDIIFSIPPALVSFAKSDYSFLNGRGNNFFPKNGGP